ncbi:MAG: 30S ribosomal protein S15 [Gemmatimonadetes bacterium]|nr:30S ribosomal protein S15 [Gemmatimonadota bacterium]
MAFSKTAALAKNQRHATDTGSPEVQVTVLTERIKFLTEHFQTHAKDHHGRRGLLMMVRKRGRLLTYLKRINLASYRKLNDELGLRY